MKRVKRRKGIVASLGSEMFRAARSPAGLSSAGLALVCGAIVINALTLQATRHPAPLFLTEDMPDQADAADDAVVHALQQKLSDAGYYRGPVDGIAGPQTRAAIAEFERDTGLVERGEATPEILSRIEAWTPGRSQGGQDPVAALISSASDRTVAAVQAALSRAAYGPLSADGVFGEQTRDAITRFQLDQGLPLTGAIDQQLIDRLQAVGALAGI